MASRRRRLIRWIVAGAAVVLFLAVAGPFIYIHFIEGSPPAKLSLPKPTSSSRATADPGIDSAGSLDGTWRVGKGSIAGYRVQEVLIGQQSTAVGRTTKIWGSIEITSETVTNGSFTVDMGSVVSDQSERNAQFDGRIMDVSAYPTASLSLSSPMDLGSPPPESTVKHYHATGVLSMHGVSRSLNFMVSAELVGNQIDALADIPITFSDWNISNPSVGGFVTTKSTGTLEVLLRLTQGPGNPASTGASSSHGSGAGEPITVPSTTVPPLKVPN